MTFENYEMHPVVLRTLLVTRAALLPLVFAGLQNWALSDTETPIAVLGPNARDLTIGPKMDASGRDLRGSRFVGQNLTHAVFDRCDLAGVRIYQCDLSHASFRGVNFAGVQVGDCKVDGADFSDALINGIGYLRGEVFHTQYTLEISPEQLKSTRSYKTKDLRQCMINGAWDAPSLDFRGARLDRAVLADGDFTHCDMSDAHVHGVTFRNFTLAFEQLASTADYRRRQLCISVRGGGTSAAGLTGRWDFNGIDLEGSDLWVVRPDAEFTDAIINGCTLRGSFANSQLYSTKSYRQGNLTQISWARVDLSECNLAGVNLTDSHFEHCDLSNAVLEDAVITRVNFLSLLRVPQRQRWEWKGVCKGLTAEQIKSTWNYKHGHMEGIVLPDELAEQLKAERE